MRSFNYQIFFITNCYWVSIRWPSDIDVLSYVQMKVENATFFLMVLPTKWKIDRTFRVDGSNTFPHSSIPNPNSFIPTSSTKEVWISFMPTKLIHTVIVASKCLLFNLIERNMKF